MQKRLQECKQSGVIRDCIFGEDWATSNEITWKRLKAHPELKNDPDLGRKNRGISIILL